jgi:outer membrane protein OmpA-like peptidoglycan-associated protein
MKHTPSGGLFPSMKLLSITALALILPLAAHAAEIRQRPFSYSLDAVVAKQDDQFVICSDCPDHRLSLLPVKPMLAMRLSDLAKPEPQIALETKPVQSSTHGSIETEKQLTAVQFDFDSERLSRHERLRFDGLLAGLSKQSTFGLKGYTCTIGTDDYNEKLSIRRANHVAGIMKSNGFNLVTVEGKGKCCPVSTDKRLNRRVDIVEHQKEEK